MLRSSHIDNPFPEFTLVSVNEFVDHKNAEISHSLKFKLESYLSSKLKKLTVVMKDEIFTNHTVYTGSAGIALLFYLYALKDKENEQEHLLRASEYVININKLRLKRPSFLCGDAGILAVGAVISYKLGLQRPSHLPDYKEIVSKFCNLLKLVKCEDTPDELLYGRAGFLYACLFINENIGEEVIPKDIICATINEILLSGQEFASKNRYKTPLLWQWHNKIYLGAAHGVTGIIYQLLLARKFFLNNELNELLKPTFDWLLSTLYPSGNLPSSVGSSNGDRLVQWCHGAPGLVSLCILAYKIWKDKSYLRVAEKCADLIWERGLVSKGYSICHGVGGNAYAFISLFNETNNIKYLYRACCFTDWAISERSGTEIYPPDRPASLFEGLAGRLYLACDILDFRNAKFPAYDL